MNGEEFYEEFKVILGQLGVRWDGKEKVQVFGSLVFTVETDGKKVIIELDVGDQQ